MNVLYTIFIYPVLKRKKKNGCKEKDFMKPIEMVHLKTE